MTIADMSQGQSLGRVHTILDKALDGERISDDEALALLESRDLVAVGRAANEVRNHKADPERITFIIDRNRNYTNIREVARGKRKIRGRPSENVLHAAGRRGYVVESYRTDYKYAHSVPSSWWHQRKSHEERIAISFR